MKDLTEGKLLETLLFARTREDNSLIDCLAGLKRAEVNMTERHEKKIETVIYKDHAPHSFGFNRLDEHGNSHGNGGIIFHGKHDNGGDGSAPTYSVSITPCNGWQIHT